MLINNPSSGSSGSTSLDAAITAISGNLPIGGKFTSLGNGESLSIPEGGVFVVTSCGARPDVSSGFRNFNITINGDSIAALGPTGDGQASADANGVFSLAMQLPLKGGQTITVGYLAVAGNPDDLFVAGYLYEDSAVAAPSYSLEKTVAFWAPGTLHTIPEPGLSKAQFLWLGDGLVLKMVNGHLDKDSRILNIESNVETVFYAGDESISLSSFVPMFGAYTSSYLSGTAMLRLVLWPRASAGDTLSDNSLFVTIRNGGAASDFKARQLMTMIPAIATGFDASAISNPRKVVVGFAGMDRLITADVNNGAKVTSADLQSWDLTSFVPVATTLTGATFATQNWEPSAQIPPGPVRITSMRGNGGRLYVVTMAGYGNQYRITMIDAVGTTFQTALNSLAASTNLNHERSTIALSQEANGSEAVAIVTPVLDANSSASTIYVSRTMVTFNASGVPQTPQTETLLTSLTANNRIDPIVSPATGQFNTYFNAGAAVTVGQVFGANGTNLQKHARPSLLWSAYQQMIRSSGGLIAGNSAGWFIPDGVFVGKRTRADIATHSAVVVTDVPNPIAVYASLTKILVVGVDGHYERLNA